MEYNEGVVNPIKKVFHKSSKTEKASQVIPGWDYEKVREYFIALTKSRDYLLPIEDYPSRMDLSKPYHEAFNEIREMPHEEWLLLGYQAGQRRLILPATAEKGLSHSVPASVMLAGLEKARAKAGITDLLGDAHSHPRERDHLSWKIPVSDTSQGEGAFSMGDLFGFLYSLTMQRPSDPKRSIMFVTEGNENIAAFATKRTLEIVRGNFSGNYEQFAKYWYEKYGWSFKGRQPESEGRGELADPTTSHAPRIWEIDKGVAYRYQLALYRGFKDRPLLREHPSRI